MADVSTLTSRFYRPSWVTLRKTLTFTGAAGLGAVGAVPLFTTTGKILIVSLSAKCTLSLTENPVPGGATLLLGVTGDTNLFIAQTTALDLNTGTFWVDATPTLYGIALPAALKDILIDQNIIATVGVSAIDGGTVEFVVRWMAESVDGKLVAA